jgi:iron complex outermembrane recepter protein
VALDYQRDDSEARADTLLGIGKFTPGVTAWNNLMISKYGVGYDNRFLPPNAYTSYATFNDPYSGLAYQPKTALNQKGISATLQWKLTDSIDAKIITAWRNWNGHFSTDQDGSPLGFSVVDGTQRFTYRTAELQLSGKAFEKLEWTVGAFYYHGNSESAQAVELPAFMGPRFALYASNPGGVSGGIPNSLLVDGLDVGRFENASGFAHGVYSLTDKWRVTLGVRYSSDKKHDDFDNTQFAGPVDSNATRFDWLVGTDYQITDNILGYGSVSTGYRPPAYNPRPFQKSQFVAVKGENMTAYELGLKSDLLDRKLRINAAIFYSDYKQRIVGVASTDCLNAPDGTPITPCIVIPKTNYVNSPGKIKGGELEVQVRPIGGLLISASTGYTKFTASDATTGGITPSGSPAYVPKWNGAASVQYVAALPSGATITPRYDAYVQTEICSGQFVTSCTAGYTIHNARLEYAATDRSWVTAFGVSNLFNKVYFLNTFDTTPFGEPTIEGQPGAPREWYFTITRNFL